MIHLGGDEVIGSCWTEDKEINSYMKKNKLNIAGLWCEWHQKVHDIIAEVTNNAKPYQVYWNDAMDNENVFADNSVVHYWTSSDKTRAINKNLKVIQSTYWYLDKMHPTTSTHYFFQDTWKDMYKIDLYESVPPSKRYLVLGGGACQWGETVWGSNFLAHMFPRVNGIAEVLWSNPAKRATGEEVTQRFEHLACKMRQSGLKVGVLDPGAPCFGEK
jgi:hexosaminidase